MQVLNFGTNASASGCPVVHDEVRVETGSKATPVAEFDRGTYEVRIFFFEKSSSATQCRLRFNRYIVKRTASGSMRLYWVKANDAGAGINKRIIALINATSGRPIPVYSDSITGQRPCPLSSCKELSTFWVNHALRNNSMSRILATKKYQEYPTFGPLSPTA